MGGEKAEEEKGRQGRRKAQGGCAWQNAGRLEFEQRLNRRPRLQREDGPRVVPEVLQSPSFLNVCPAPLMIVLSPPQEHIHRACPCSHTYVHMCVCAQSKSHPCVHAYADICLQAHVLLRILEYSWIPCNNGSCLPTGPGLTRVETEACREKRLV